ncbi:hypothetical protein BKI52_01575 [marine bacterium AO1-C]|nr:hypothetical protein BKI52_01575 [marine bacterium AO1-C]
MGKVNLKMRVLIGLLVLMSWGSYAQVAPVNNQAYFNPYLYNPAWVGQSGYTQLFAGFNKQWAGVTGSPTIATLSFEKPLESGLSLGGQLVNQTEGPINRLRAQVTGGYKIAVGLEGFIHFGMSLGMAYDNFNVAQLDDPNDPLATELAQSQIQFDGGVGLGYEFRGLKVGVSIPNFLAPRPFVSTNDANQLSYSPWDYMIGTLSLTIDQGMEWIFEPTLMYHYYKDFDGQIEGGLKATFREKFWGGALYNQNLGLTAFLGLNISDLFSFGYLYSFSSPTAGVPNDSHELVLRFRFGKSIKD